MYNYNIMRSYGGTHLCSFDINIQCLWGTDYNNVQGTSRIMLDDTRLGALINDKLYVIIRFPFNISLAEFQKEMLLDAIIRRGYRLEHVVSLGNGPVSHEYIMKKT